jgi:hypothetical protein
MRSHKTYKCIKIYLKYIKLMVFYSLLYLKVFFFNSKQLLEA